EAQRFGEWGIDTAGMDTSVRPGEDFFAYVSGTWAENTEIPSDKSMYGSFLVLRDLSEARVRQLLEGYQLGDPAGPDNAAKLAALYQGFMDEQAVEDRKSTRLNSSHVKISYAVFCLKKKKKKEPSAL